MIMILLIYRSHSKKQNSSIDVSWELLEHTEFVVVVFLFVFLICCG